MTDVATTPPLTGGRKALLVVGGVVTAAVLLLEVYLGAVLAYAWFWPFPPAWTGVVLSLIAALIGPVAAVVTWRRGQSRSITRGETFRRVERVAFGLGLLSLLFLMAMLAVAAPF